MDAPTLDDSDPPARDPETALSLGGRRGLAGVLATVGGTAAGTESFGRYRIGRRLGAGAFGEVYEAFDPNLRRAVALKLLKGTAGSAHIDRLRREARAMAAIDDPALVTVFEIGEAQGRDFIAMELVRGTTLAGWAAAHPIGTRARFEGALRLLVAAGHGLAVAHARGIVHRDFKPANVLVGDDGRAKVADFGLARELPDDDGAPTRLRTHPGRGAGDDVPMDALAPTLTRTGAILGTPRYMAPEQHDGRRADAKSDQFGFAVAAWEVIHGEPPFAGRSIAELREAIAREPALPRPVAGVPSWVAPVLRRALAERPADRHPSMHALLQALADAPRRRRRGIWLGLATVLVGTTALSLRASAPGPRCDDETAAREIASLWEPARKRAVTSAVRATGVPYEGATLRALDLAFTDYRERWVAHYVASCRATWHAGTASESLLDRRVACLRDDLATADALVTRLESASPSLAERAMAAVDGLPDPQRCDDPDGVTEPAGARSLRKELAVARAASLAGEYPAAIEHAQWIVDAALAAGTDGLRGEALQLVGLARNELAPGDGTAALEEAYALAIAQDRPLRAAEDAQYVAVAWSRAGDLDAADRWIRHAEAALARVAEPPPDVAARLERARCNVHEARGRLDDAIAHCRAATETLESQAGFDPTLAWTLRMSTANVLVSLGRIQDAEAMLVQLRDDATARLGAQHPKVGGALMNLGSAADAVGDSARAIEHYRAALEVFRAAYGPEHAWVVSALMNIGTAEGKRGDLDRADAVLSEALAIVGGRRDARAARVMFNLADLRRRQRRFDDVLTLVSRVADIESETLPPGHIQTAHTHHLRALAYLELGRLDEARVEIERVLELRAASPKTREVAIAYGVLARIAAAQGRVDEAIAAAEHAEAIHAQTQTPPRDRAANLSRLAELLVERGRIAPARAHASAALALLDGDPEADPEANEAERERIRGWLHTLR